MSSWLLRISANLIIDRGRQGNRLVLLGDNPLPEQHLDSPVEPQPEEWVARWERAAWLRQHMASLPEDQQRALRLGFWEGHSVAEVGVQLGRNENATKQLLHRAMTNLRVRITPEERSHA